jgi:hypothetical protein
VHVMKRSLLLVTVAIVLAAGCSSTKSTDVAAPGSETTVVSDPSLLAGPDTTVATAPTSTSSTIAATFSGDEAAAEATADAFCAAYYTTRTVGQGLGDVTDLRVDGLVVLAATDQLRGAAQAMRDNTPGELAGSTNSYADQVDRAGQALAAVTNLRQLGEAVKILNDAVTDPATQPTIGFMVRCTAPNAAADVAPDPAPEPTPAPDPAPDPPVDPAA